MIVSRPEKLSPLLDPTPKKRQLSWPTVYVGQCTTKGLRGGHALADRGVPHGEGPSLSQGKQLLVDSEREEADVM